MVMKGPGADSEARTVALGPVMRSIEQMRHLTDAQAAAALEPARDVVVTAGAGSGKTLTLVARYLSLLERGVHPRQILAITFTEKAALEMRARVRSAVTEAADNMADAGTRERWLDLEAAMDSARIGTIHSFCAEVLRTHPAEAGLDPAFEVVEEGLAAQLKAQAADDALSWLAGSGANDMLLFQLLTPRALRILIIDLLGQRLDADDVLRHDPPATWEDLILATARGFVERPDVGDAVGAIKDMVDDNELLDDAGDKLCAQLESLMTDWADVTASVSEQRGIDAAIGLCRLRHPGMHLSAGKRTSSAKSHLRRLQELYDEHAAPWLGGKPGKDEPCTESESHFASAEPSLRRLYDRAARAYNAALRQRRAVDFDTLEGVAVELLEQPHVGDRWRSAFDAVLVDEFQDTNRRQVRIVEALRGNQRGKLFLVGDARQSIYRFRGADVTAFQELHGTLVDAEALRTDLDTSFRSHDGLLLAFDALLPPLMGDDRENRPPYWVPYTRLNASMEHAADGVHPPFTEAVLGIGSNAEGARSAAAHALAARLSQLHADGEIAQWDDVALLFRASSSFDAYEKAFEKAHVPFITVAGRGFYDRPEIRDVLGMLRALVQPWDDASMAGLLRSPAVGVSDVGLYQLRCRGSEVLPIRAALEGDLAELGDADRARAARARDVLRELEPMVDRLSVAALLKHLIDRTDYRAVLATSPLQRPWRNLDKLMADAHRSGKVRVREFLEYLTTLKDVGAREGEAPAEAAGAVQLMTVHMAKGLQFPFVVLADASHGGGGGPGACFLEPEYGAAAKLDKLDSQPLAYRISKWRDGLQSQAESMRLLYVAMTRAEQKLLVCGGVTERSSGLAAAGWLGEILDGVGFDLDLLPATSGEEMIHTMAGGAQLRVSTPGHAGDRLTATDDGGVSWPEWPDSDAPSLWSPTVSVPEDSPDPDHSAAVDEDVRDDEPERDWRATGGRRAPPEVIGRMVHRAVECWCFPGDAGFEQLMRAEAYREKLVNQAQREQAIDRVAQLLARLQDHALWIEIDEADERHHEVPFVDQLRGSQENAGVIDLFYRLGHAWHIVDFKTDSVGRDNVLAGERAKYAAQVRWYARSVRKLLNVSPAVRLCFLDCDREVWLEEVDDSG